MSREFFNSRAAIWDETAAERDTLKLQAMVDRLGLNPGMSVLDIGTGTGIFVSYILAKIGQSGKLVCLDYAEEMLKVARGKIFTGRISFICADIMESGLPDNAFDAAICYSVFPHFENKLRALKEIYRLLKRNGWLFICHTSSRQQINDIHRSIPEVCSHLFPENNEMREMLKESGFIDVSIDDGLNDYLASARKSNQVVAKE